MGITDPLVKSLRFGQFNSAPRFALIQSNEYRGRLPRNPTSEFHYLDSCAGLLYYSPWQTQVVVKSLRLLMIYAIGVKNIREMCHSEVYANLRQTYTTHPKAQVNQFKIYFHATMRTTPMTESAQHIPHSKQINSHVVLLQN